MIAEKCDESQCRKNSIPVEKKCRCVIEDKKVSVLLEDGGDNDGALDAWISEAIAAEPKAAEDVAVGKDAAIGRLVGRSVGVSLGRSVGQPAGRLAVWSLCGA